MSIPLKLCSTLIPVAVILTACSSTDDTVDQDTVELYRTTWNENSRLKSEIANVEERIALQCMESRGYPQYEPSDTPLTDARDVELINFHNLSPKELREEAYYPLWGWLNQDELNPKVLTPEEEAAGEYHTGTGQKKSEEFWFDYWGPALAEALYSDDETQNAGSETDDNPGKESFDIEEGMTIEWETDGCLGEAKSRLYGDDIFDFKRLEAIATARPTDDSKSDPEVQDADAEWTECMRDKGHTLDSSMTIDTAIMQEEVRLGNLVSDGTIGDSEYSAKFDDFIVDLARDDADCLESTANPRQKSADVFYRNLAEYLPEYETEVFAYQQEAEKHLTKAQKILEG
ncbi:hypothetical protein [Haloglycomyces albus]|uniref:hypothetical protein n=1 Tax=Haloglycomyces albus TaxID=526067 RepID=UPI00046D5F86|nr:hypothetical protein [Haloglycomyces albus]